MGYKPAHLISAAEAHGDSTCAEMARTLGVPYISAYRWYTGRNSPNAQGLAAIERAYGVTAAEILTEAA